jgi:hypothetical protein
MVLARPGGKVAHGSESRKNSDSVWRRLTETTHYAAGTPSCEQKITVKNGAFLATMKRSAARV